MAAKSRLVRMTRAVPTPRPPPSTRDEFVSALRNALRECNRPDLLTRNPLLHARLLAKSDNPGPAELRALIVTTVNTLFASPRDERIRRVIELTYFKAVPKQEVVADRLGLPFGTYRRHLTSGLKRLTDWLWQEEQAASETRHRPSDHAGEVLDEPAAGLPSASRAPRLSIVVLPFVNLGNPEDDYFADGITENLTTDISRIPDAFVIARATAFSYKGKAIDLRQLGRDLGVRYVLEGSIQGAADRVRFNAQLLDAESGAHLWAERFDKPRGALFDMQDEVTARLARMVDVELVAAESRRAERKAGYADSTDLAMRGRAVLNEHMSVEAAHRARDFFEQALRLDECNVAALLGLADAHMWEVNMYVSDDRTEQIRIADAAVLQALSLAPGNANVRCSRGTVLHAMGMPDRALREFELAIAIDRNLAVAHAYSGLMKFYLGRPVETEAHVAEAMRLSPRDPLLFHWHYIIGSAELYLGRRVQAVIRLRQSVELNSHWPLSHFVLTSALAQAGLAAEAEEMRNAALRLAPHFTVAKFRAQLVSRNPDYLVQRERLCEGLCNAGVPES